MTHKPQLLLTVFSDYICPFCYIGLVRLEKLRDSYDLKVNWCSIEIHPDTPSEGMPVTQLSYNEEQWNEMIGELGQMAEQEGLAFAPHTLTTNSHKALLLSEAAKELGSDQFYLLHRRIFAAYFCDGKNIGNEFILRDLAKDIEIPDELIERAWSDAKYELRLQENLKVAQELGVSGTPTYFFAHGKLTGAVTTQVLRDAARNAIASSSE